MDHFVAYEGLPPPGVWCCCLGQTETALSPASGMFQFGTSVNFMDENF